MKLALVALAILAALFGTALYVTGQQIDHISIGSSR